MERRIRKRQPVDVQVTCRVPATPYKARMVDATRTGCRLQLRNVRLEVGGSLSIEIGPDAVLTGRVVWRTAIEVGVAFDQALRTPLAVMLGVEEQDPVIAAEPLQRPAA